MKITKVEVMKLKTDNHFTPIVCRIHTDEGIYGDGEAALAYGYGRYAAFKRRKLFFESKHACPFFNPDKFSV